VVWFVDTLGVGLSLVGFIMDSLPNKHCPDLPHLLATNGDLSDAGGLKLSMAIGSDCVDLEPIQVLPYGLAHFDESGFKVRSLAVKALRSAGSATLVIRNEPGCRFYITNMVRASHGITLDNCTGFFLHFNSKVNKVIAQHCKYYKDRVIMKSPRNIEESAAAYRTPLENTAVTFMDLSEPADAQAKDLEGGPYDAHGSKKGRDGWGRKSYHILPLEISDQFYSDQLHIVTAILAIYRCMGGPKSNADAERMNANDKVFGSLFGSVNVVKRARDTEATPPRTRSTRASQGQQH